MSVYVIQITCDCGKWHCASGVWQSTICSCGARLWPMLWDGQHDGWKAAS